MTSSFDDALAYTLENEGRGYVNDPDDSGGPTNCGVTLKAWGRFVRRPATAAEIEALTEDQIRSFYAAGYWDPLRCAGLRDAALAIALFDTGVLYGVATAAVIAQKTVRTTPDGVLGPVTVAALNRAARASFLERFHDFVLARIELAIHVNPKNEKFRKGWTSRAHRLLTLLSLPVVNST